MSRIYHGAAYETPQRSTVAEVIESDLRLAVIAVERMMRQQERDERGRQVQDDLLGVHRRLSLLLALMEEGRALRDVVEAEAVGRG